MIRPTSTSTASSPLRAGPGAGCGCLGVRSLMSMSASMRRAFEIALDSLQCEQAALLARVCQGRRCV